MRTYIKISGIIIAFLAISSITQAQKCKYDYQKTDEITGKAVKGISVNLNKLSFVYYSNTLMPSF